MNRTAACVPGALRDPAVTFESIPCVFGLARRSVGGIRKNLAAGLESREEAGRVRELSELLDHDEFAGPYAGRRALLSSSPRQRNWSWCS